MRYPLGQTITVVRPTWVADTYGDPQPTGPPTRTEVPGCAVAPRSSSDTLEPARQGVLVGLTLYAPTGTDLQPTDHIEVAGELYDIEGDIGRWHSPFSPIADGLEVALRRAIA